MTWLGRRDSDTKLGDLSLLSGAQRVVVISMCACVHICACVHACTDTHKYM